MYAVGTHVNAQAACIELIISDIGIVFVLCVLSCKVTNVEQCLILYLCCSTCFGGKQTQLLG
jgi:hypothetical protein